MAHRSTAWVLVLALFGCTSAPSGSIDGGPPLDLGPPTDMGPPIDTAPTLGHCVVEDGSTGRQCVGGPCPFECCQSGLLATCTVFAGSECAFAPVTHCGGDTCVVGPGPCADAGADAGGGGG